MKILVFDMETLAGFFLCSFYNPEEKKFYEFGIGKFRNDLYRFIKFLEDHKDYYLVGFNSINFDSQILEYIWRNYEHWHRLTHEEIVNLIYLCAQDTISDSNYGARLRYPEDSLSFNHIDLFKIHHYDNEARRTSLKWLEYMMNSPSVEEMPISHNIKNLTPEDIKLVESYCRNDILETHRNYLYTIGEVDHEVYKGKNKIQDRLDLISEGLLPKKAINYADSKIGDELNKLAYCKLTNRTINDLYELKKNRKPTRKFTYGDAIPKYVQFKTQELNDFYNKLKNIKVSLKEKDDQFFPLTFRGTNYKIARGGIHSCEKNRIIIPKTNEILRDADVGSQYPNAIRKRNLYPEHLGPLWNQVGRDNINTRLIYKSKANDKTLPESLRKKYKGLSEMYKLALNSGYFGKTIERTNWQYGPEVGYYCTIGNQFEILMLIEMMELKGIHCVSANTDGIVCLFNSNLEKDYYEVCHEWENIVGNSDLGKLEYTDFKGLYQESVNHYVAVKSDGSVKVKGRFSVEDELHKNNSDKISRIERKAFVKYFSEGIPVEKTIMESENIFDFLIGKKSSRDYRWETVDSKGNIEIYKRLIRFYISKDGKKLIKRKNENSDATGAEITQFFDGYLVTIQNDVRNLESSWRSKVNYDYYIDNIKKVINKIEKNRKNKNYVEPPKAQLSLF